VKTIDLYLLISIVNVQRPRLDDAGVSKSRNRQIGDRAAPFNLLKEIQRRFGGQGGTAVLVEEFRHISVHAGIDDPTAVLIDT